MSRRWGISIPSSSFPNEICFINSGMYHPRAGENRPAPNAAANFAAPERGRKTNLDCRARCVDHVFVVVKVGEAGNRGWNAADCSQRQFPVPGSLFPLTSLLHLDGRALLFQLGLELGRLVLRD